MKKHRIWPVLLLSAALCAFLAAIGFYVTFYLMKINEPSSYEEETELAYLHAVLSGEIDETDVTEENEKLTEDKADEGLEALSEHSSEPAQDEQDTSSAPFRVLFVGDSRTVGMRNALIMQEHPDDCLYCGESGEGYSWFVKTGIKLMTAYLRKYPNIPVVINLGVNDTESLQDYLDLYAGFDQRFPDTEFYFMSVNPVTEESVHVTNSDIDEFNSVMKEIWADHYIDSNTWMRENDFKTVDGVHYTRQTYCGIHDYVLSVIYPQYPIIPLIENTSEEND